MVEKEENPQAKENSQQPSRPERPESAEQPEITKQARMWAMFCHLTGLAGYVMPFIGNIVAPLIVWQIKKDEYPFVDEQGKEAVNFQISMTLYAIISVPLIFIIIGVFLLVAVVVVDLVLLLIAAVKANNGRSYRYPLTIRFIK